MYKVSKEEENKFLMMNDSNVWKGHSKKKIHEVTKFSQFISEK